MKKIFVSFLLLFENNKNLKMASYSLVLLIKDVYKVIRKNEYSE